MDIFRKPIFNSVVNDRLEGAIQIAKTSAVAVFTYLVFFVVLAELFDQQISVALLAIAGTAQLLTGGVITSLHVRQSIAGAQKRTEILRQSEIDDLTGLLNRRSFMRQFSEACEPQSKAPPSSLVLIDIDRFKNVNDVYGHQAGDDVLVAVAGILGSHRAGRVGGEEFAIILPTGDLEAAAAVAENIRQQIERIEIKATESVQAISVTASLGLSTITAGRCRESYQRADQALYAAKSAGRNTVRRADEGEEPRPEPLPA